MDSSPEQTPYELMVKRNIEANRQVLKSLGLLEPVKEVKDTKPRKPRKSSNPQQIIQNRDVEAEILIPVKRTRRSSSILKSLGYNEFDDVPIIFNNEENTPPVKKEKAIREHVFGEIEGVSVGDWWQTRMECSSAGVHRPTVAGIHGKLGAGCYSIALSGGYEDDVDYGDCFTYTGCGGRDLKGTKVNPKNLRTAPQSKDQVLDGLNAALASNIETKLPVRVIRGYKLQSQYAPQEGYRYDGLYSVEKCWVASGLSGFKVCKFALKRILDQDPPPWITHPSILSAEKQHVPVTPILSLIPKLELSPSEQNSLEKTNISSKVVSPLPNAVKDSVKEKTASPLSDGGKMKTPPDEKRKGTNKRSSDSKGTVSSKEIKMEDQEKETLCSFEDVTSTLEKKKENENINCVMRVKRLSNGIGRDEEKSEESPISNHVGRNENTLSKKKREPPKRLCNSGPTDQPIGLPTNGETNSVSPSSTHLPKTNNTSAKKRKEIDDITPETKLRKLSNEVTRTAQNKSSPKSKIEKIPTPSLSDVHESEKELSETENCSNNDGENDESFHGFSELQDDEPKTKSKNFTNFIDFKDSIDRFEVNITSVRENQSSSLKSNCVRMSGQEIKDFETPSGSRDRKVRFSPNVCYTDYEGSAKCSEDFFSLQSTDTGINKTTDDGKKQTLILKYFVPVRKAAEIQPAKPVVNPKCLRGNRFTSFSLVTYSDVRQKSEKSCLSKKNNSYHRVSEGEVWPNGVFPESAKSTSANRRKSWSQKRKHSSLDSNRESYRDVENNLSKKGPSMMENLIKQNNDKLRLHNQKKSKKRKTSRSTTSPVKPCFVSLVRVEEIFIGWDTGDEGVFNGFTMLDEIAAQQKTDGSKKVYKTVYDSQWSLKWLAPDPSSKDSFHGWNSNEDFRGARGLVPIGFIIDKLSES